MITDPLIPGRWYWVRLGYWPRNRRIPHWAWRLLTCEDKRSWERPHYQPARLLEITDAGLEVGFAQAERATIVEPGTVFRPLTPAELSEYIGGRPLDWGWEAPEPVDTVSLKS